MLLKSFIILCFVIVFIVSIIFLKIKKCSLHFSLNLIIWEISISYIIATVFFPFPFQKQVIEEKLYEQCEQSFTLFKNEIEIISSEINIDDKIEILISYFFSKIISQIYVGLVYGIAVAITMNCKNKRILLCILFSSMLQLIKLMICFLIKANYMIITIDNIIYILCGCLLGMLLIKVIRWLVVDVDYRSSFFCIIKDYILLNE